MFNEIIFKIFIFIEDKSNFGTQKMANQKNNYFLHGNTNCFRIEKKSNSISFRKSNFLIATIVYLNLI